MSSSIAPPSHDWNKFAESDFVQPLQSRHLCELCDSLLKEPLQLSCGDLFCRLCIEPHLTNDSRFVCPKCGEELDRDRPAFPDNSAKKEILTKLKVFCRNKLVGCEESFCLRDKDDHESRCPFESRPCRFREWGCEESPAERDKDTHYADCAFRPVECPHCGECVAKCRLDDPHLKDACLSVKMDCPFGCGRKELLREELNEHKLLCPLRTVPCPFHDVGCAYEGTPNDLSDHSTQSSVDHLSLSHDKIVCLETEQHSLKNEITHLSSENEELKKNMEEQAAIFRSNVDDLKRQLAELADKMHTVENEVYRLSNCVSSTSSASLPSQSSLSPHNSTPVAPSSASSSTCCLDSQQAAELQQNEETQPLVAKLDQSAVTTDVTDMKREMRRLAKKLSELEVSQSRSSLNGFNGSESSLASSARSQSSIDKKINLHDQWLKDLDLRLQISDTATYDGVLIWKINEYARRKRNAETGSALSLYSQPFYTSKYGYKMCCRVYLNGDGLGKGSHMSLFFSIMKGEYDSLLRWPFTQKVTLMLLDQGTGGTPGSKHLVDSFRPDPKSNSFQRPTTEMNIASGCPLFVAQNVVEDGNMYRKDDTIYIKCIVENRS